MPKTQNLASTKTMINRWDIRWVICDKEDVKWIRCVEMLPPSFPQSNPTSVTFQHSLALCWGSNWNYVTSGADDAICRNAVHSVSTERESDIICLSPVWLFIFLYFLHLPHQPAGPVWFTEPGLERNQKVRGGKIKKAKTKRPQNGESEDIMPE